MTTQKNLKAATLALVLGFGIASAAIADNSRGRGHSRNLDNLAAAVVVSSLIGAAVAASQPVYAAPPTYYTQNPAVYYGTPAYYSPDVYIAPRYGYWNDNQYRGHHHRYNRW